jgi:hypothetical protein
MCRIVVRECLGNDAFVARHCSSLWLKGRAGKKQKMYSNTTAAAAGGRSLAYRQRQITRVTSRHVCENDAARLGSARLDSACSFDAPKQTEWHLPQRRQSTAGQRRADASATAQHTSTERGGMESTAGCFFSLSFWVLLPVSAPVCALRGSMQRLSWTRRRPGPAAPCVSDPLPPLSLLPPPPLCCLPSAAALLPPFCRCSALCAALSSCFCLCLCSLAGHRLPSVCWLSSQLTGTQAENRIQKHRHNSQSWPAIPLPRA